MQITQEKPKNIATYIRWLSDEHGVRVSHKTKTRYDSVVFKIQKEFENSEFWKAIHDRFDSFEQTYHLDTGFNLFISNAIPVIVTKPFKSFLLKTFRKNCLDNLSWPEPPDGGWLWPDRCYAQINDLVRTCFIVKYLDGVNRLLDSIHSICEAVGTNCRVDFEAKEEGYYAAHAYIDFTCHVPKHDWDTEEISVPIELQVTTQLQEIIKTMLHSYYEDRRKITQQDRLSWQWDYTSDEFATNYLGHILHYLEGMIMGVRSRQMEDKK